MNPQKELKLNHLAGSLSVDGMNVFIRVQGDVPFIHFIQLRSEDEKHVYADVVTSVRLENIEQLEGLAKTITDTVKQHKNREK